MSMYGAYVTTRNIRGESKRHNWYTPGTWAGCFAGLSYTNARHLADDRTAIASVYLASASRRVEPKTQAVQEAFLFSPFAQRLTDYAFIAANEVDATHRAGARDELWEALAGARLNQNFYESIKEVHFNAQRHQDLLITAFRISKQCSYNTLALRDIPERLWHVAPLAQALIEGDGKAYCDSYVAFGTPTADQVKEYCGQHWDGDMDEMDMDDLAEAFDGTEQTHVTVDGVADMFSRTTEQFADLCRQGMGQLICGYTKDCGLDADDIAGLRGDDPIGLAAPLRMKVFGGKRFKQMSLLEACELLSELN